MSTPEQVIAEVLHHRDCLDPNVCKAAPSKKDLEAARAIVAALAAHRFMDCEETWEDTAIAEVLRERLTMLELGVRNGAHPTVVAEYTALRALWEQAWQRVRSGAPPPAVLGDDSESIQDLVHLLGVLWLYIPWREVTRNLTTVQKELLADCVREWSASMHPDDPAEPERWWRG